MRRVIIESPFRESKEYSNEENIAYARMCLKDSLDRGESPLASHLLYTQVLIDSDPEQRELGLSKNFAWYCVAHCVVFYTDHGITEGMQQGLSYIAKNNNDTSRVPILFEFRRIGEINANQEPPQT